MYNIYLISTEINEKKYYKIGFTRRPVEVRVRELKTGNASDFEIIDAFTSEWGTKIESQLHRRYKSKRVNREWFELDESDIKSFHSECQVIHNNLNYLKENGNYFISKLAR